MSDIIHTGTMRPSQVSPGITRDRKHNNHRQRVVLGSILWFLAVIALVALAFFAHTHRQPMPFELAISKSVQAIAFPAWVTSTFRFLTFINDPRPDEIEVPIVLVLFLLFRWF